jgi:hypothetical protein
VCFMTDPSPPSSETQPHPLDGVPGCGVAAYALVLICFFLIGIGGMLLSSAALWQASSASPGPSRLLAGENVKVWRLQPMRDAGLLTLTEMPLVWHDESATGDGVEACAMTDDAVIRVEGAAGFEVLYADVERVDVVEEGAFVIVETYNKSGDALRCFFHQDEGGEKMARMIRSESGLVGSYRRDNDL